MFSELEDNLNKELITTKYLTSNFKFIDLNSKKTVKYNDNFYIPFFYYLGKLIKPTKFFEIGINLSFLSSTFFKSCTSVDYFLAFQEKISEHYNFNIARSNFVLNYKGKYDFYYGGIKDEDFSNLYNNYKFDLILINQTYNYDLLFEITDTIYSNILNKNGLMIFSNLNEKNNFDIFMNIVKSYNAEFKIFKSKIGVLIK